MSKQMRISDYPKDQYKECPHCGTLNPENQVFCVKCRRRFVDSYG